MTAARKAQHKAVDDLFQDLIQEVFEAVAREPTSKDRARAGRPPPMIPKEAREFLDLAARESSAKTARKSSGKTSRKSYPARPIKRIRSTKAEVKRRRDALFGIVAEAKPATVRQVYYLATVAGLVPKTENGYGIVQADLTLMRRAGDLPYGWLADSTRWQRKPDTFGSVEEALKETARLYRKDLWRDADSYVEIWLEKDALSGVVYPITSQFDTPLMVARGYASLSFLNEAAEYIASLDVPAYIYHLGDYDPSGQDAARAIEQTLRELVPEAEIHFERLAVHPEQIVVWNLPTRPTKATDSRAKGFGAVSVELDAIPPNRLRDLVQEAIERHLPPDQYAVLKVAEESEQKLIHGLVGMLKGAAT